MNSAIKRAFRILAVTWTCLTVSSAAQAPPVDFNGRWEVDIPGGPWWFELIVDGNVVTGKVMQRPAESGPAEIFDGRVNGATITFKCKNPVAAKIITFTGQASDGQIQFRRSVEVLLDGTVDNSANGYYPDRGLFGAIGSEQFVAVRTGSAPRPAVAIRPPGPTPVDPTGRWESLQWNLDVWAFELKVNGNTLTGALEASGGPGRAATTSPQPAGIFEGKIDGNKITFKSNSPDNARVVAFTGIVQDDEIAFRRTLEIPPGGSFGPDTLFGAYAPTAFVAKRVTNSSAENPPLKALQEAKAKWTARTIQQYELTIAWQCLCRMATTPVTFRVNGSTPVAQPNPRMPALNGATLFRDEVERFGSVDRIMEVLNAAAIRRPYSMKIEYDPTYGYPMSGEVRAGGISTDSDLRFTVTGFRVLQ